MSDTKKSNNSDQPIISFNSPQEWNSWLEQNHGNSNGVWLRIFKKDTGIPTTTHAQALQEALCFGWIDGQAKKYDEHSYLQKFTPRRTKSIWSKRNVEYVAQLEKEGRMKPAGREQIEAAKADGRWDRAYDSPVNMTMPEDFLTELAKNEKALAFFKTLNKTNTFAIGWRLQTAKKPETREKRMKMILEMLAREEKFH
ncbi:MAG: bacteriocin-protection protein, YdeI/OmpD-associated family [Bacteroidetes bacterium GWF2_41_31]|nr:MAG: bacteriocin-protection protein, YdeI/OmpD-associated family [Bacteroidetes bacterium GWF2_41_31]